jgi:T-complex protein 1 subunit beta
MAEPVQILEREAQEEKGETARLSSFVGAIAISDLIKTTLGPKGMDKILLNSHGEVTVTNDGATILKSIHLDNPSAKVLVDIAKTQDDEIGDGTTSVAVLAGELLREAERLIEQQKLHPQSVILGYRAAQDAALKKLKEIARDNSRNLEQFRQDLLNVASTTLSSKILAYDKEHFSKLCVDAVLRLKGSTDLQSIHIIKKKGGTLQDSYLDEGFILEKKFGVGGVKRLENPKILIANTAMDHDKIKIFAAKVKTDDLATVAAIEKAERERMYAKCDKIIAHGINCFINRQLIYNLPEQYFADRGVMSIEHADFAGIERLALVLGGEIVSTFDNPEGVKLGTCRLIEETMIGEDKVIKFVGVPRGEACTIVLRGATDHMLDEAERSIHDALCVLSQTVKDSLVVCGGGSSEMAMATAVFDLARKTSSKEAAAIESFGNALTALPTILADNAGFDSSELVAQLKAAHAQGQHNVGLNLMDGNVGDMITAGVTDSYKLKRQVVLSASEAAEMILRVDRIIKAAPRKRVRDEYPC